MKIRITHLGTASVILEIGGVRVITDPVFDPAGSRYKWAPVGGSSTKTEGPLVPVETIGAFDAALVSHAQHEDNLDRAGRAALASARRVLTTRASARRLGGHAEGLAEWETVEIAGAGGTRIRVTATPARHGPPLSLPFVGKVIGFILEWDGQDRGPLYISGDTVVFGGLAKIAARYRVGVALLHMGQAKLPITGPFRLTMDAAGAAHATKLLGAHTVVPLHYDGWTHFSEPREAAVAAFETAGVTDRVRWLPKGTPVELDV
ncbi:MAG: MBL fold metallo-hydrolase [Deltaproteobacteria bacterium]|nr:MBL fold metallo-hydrolase [Deltaproteobacteria bacterium]